MKLLLESREKVIEVLIFHLDIDNVEVMVKSKTKIN